MYQERASLQQRPCRDSGRSNINGRSDNTYKPSCGCVTCNIEVPGWDQLDNLKTTCVDRLCTTVRKVGPVTHPCRRCWGRIGRCRTNCRGGQARNLDMHAAECWTSCMEAIRVLSGVVPELSLLPGDPDWVWRCWCAAALHETDLKPWQKVGKDMFVYKSLYTYLIVVDYASSYLYSHVGRNDIVPDVISSFVYHIISLSNQFVEAMLWSVVQLRRGRLRWLYIRCGQLLVMWAAVCSGSSYSHAALSVSPLVFVDDHERPTPVRSLVRCPFLSTQIFCPAPFNWIWYVRMFSSGSGCFPLLLPGCRNPCIVWPVLWDVTWQSASSEPL